MFQKTTLNNGMRVVTAEMPHTRSVSMCLFVGVGSRYETDAQAGISHFLEHMVFKGTAMRPEPQQISAAIESVGGIINAATEHELTVYWCKVAQPYFADSLDILFDIIRNSLYEPDAVEKERQVIFEELAMINDYPGYKVEMLIDEMLWPGHPLGRDIGGTRDSVAGITRAMMLDYAAKHYTPPNIVVSVAGNIAHPEVVAHVERLSDGWHAPAYGGPADTPAASPDAPDANAAATSPVNGENGEHPTAANGASDPAADNHMPMDNPMNAPINGEHNTPTSDTSALDTSTLDTKNPDTENQWTPKQWIPYDRTQQEPQSRVEYRRTEQAHLSVALPGVSLTHPQRYALDLLSVALGEGMSSRLFVEVREKRGLAYDVHSEVSHFSDTGALIVSAGVDPKRVYDAVQTILEQVGALRSGVPEDELEKAKRLSAGRLMLRMEDTRSVANWMGQSELLLGEIANVDDVIAQVNAVTPADVLSLANEVLISDRLNIAVVGPCRGHRRIHRMLKL